MPVCTLLAVLCFLARGTRTVGTSDILLLLGLRLHLVVLLGTLAATAKLYSIHQYVFYVAHVI